MSELIETALSEILAGSSIIRELAATYDDVHTLWGGVILTIKGNGHSERRLWTPGAIDPKITLGFVTPEEIRELTELLVQQKVWEQPPIDRTPTPDEAMASLTIRIADVQMVCKEWLRDGRRLQAVKNLMSRLVVSEYQARGTVDNETNIETFRNALWPVLTRYGKIPVPSEQEIASENYTVTAPDGVGVQVRHSQGNSDPYDSVVANATLTGINLVEPQSGATVQCSFYLQYLAWSAPELEIRLSGPPSIVRTVKKALEPALEQCDFHPRAN